MPIKRVFLIVLDSLGAGEAPDAAKFGDAGAHTLRSLSKSNQLNIKNLLSLGISEIEGLDFLGKSTKPIAALAKMQELSAGKDTTIGHWEIAGIVSDSPLPTFADGFDEEIIKKFETSTGRKVICNKPYSGTAVINDYGDEHLRTGALIVYTSADSVFQIAAHEDIIGNEELYDICRTARELLKGKYGVGRVIARPFAGSSGKFYRTSNRRDFSLEPPRKTMCDAIKESGLDCISVGKISDIFASRGFTESYLSHSNSEGMNITKELALHDFCGLCFVNLVDFDMIYGHRRDVDGYAKALSEFDAWLGDFIKILEEDDVLMITADHGCDPAFTKTTDHTREYAPLLVYGDKIAPKNLGIREGFCDIAAEVCAMLSVDFKGDGHKMLLLKDKK